MPKNLFSGADVSNVVNESIFFAMRRRNGTLTENNDDLNSASNLSIFQEAQQYDLIGPMAMFDLNNPVPERKLSIGVSKDKALDSITIGSNYPRSPSRSPKKSTSSNLSRQNSPTKPTVTQSNQVSMDEGVLLFQDLKRGLDRTRTQVLRRERQCYE